MTHNEISAMYRDVLKAVGIGEPSLSTDEGQFWDKRIYNFATLARNAPDNEVHRRLLIDATQALMKLPSIRRGANGN